MRCLTPFLIVALLALFGLVGYNTWQINQLRTELVAAKSGVHRPEQVKADKEIAQLLDEAKQQTQHARDMMSGGQVKKAQTELNESLKKLEKASRLSKDMAEGAVRGVGGAVDSLKHAFGGGEKKGPGKP